MPSIRNRPPLITDEIYHVVIRGVADSEIFRDIQDYYRAIFSLYEFNDVNEVSIRERRRLRQAEKKLARDRIPGEASERLQKKQRVPFVEILTFCFMPNHIHLLLRQIRDKGISEFMRKLGVGYAGYFNLKYGRKGHLFQGRFRAVHIKDEQQLRMAFVYIHTNPVALIAPGFKEKGIENPAAAIKFLNDFRWSSYLDYIGKKNFPSVTSRDFLLDILGSPAGCKNEVESWILYKAGKEDFGETALE